MTVDPPKPGDRVELHTDGAAQGNPKVGGWAWRCEDREDSGGVAGATQNQMELRAVIEGLNALEPGRVRVVSDSRYVVLGITSWISKWQRNGWRIKTGPVKNVELWQELLVVIDRHESVSFKWIRGHQGHVENERVDQLAVEAARAMKGTHVPR